MNLTETGEIISSSSLLLNCQETIFGVGSAIEVQGYLSVCAWAGGVLSLAFFLLKIDSWSCETCTFLSGSIIGGIGAFIGGGGIIGNMILAPIILGECGIDADHVFVTSILFLISLATVFVGAIPSVALFFLDLKTIFKISVIIFCIIAGLCHIIGNIMTFYQLSQYHNTQ